MVKREKKQVLQIVLDLVFWICCGLAFFAWARFVLVKGNSLPISYSGLDAVNSLAVYGAKELLIDYLIIVGISYFAFFLFALFLYVVTHYYKWCLVLKKKPTLKGIKAFALLASLYSIPLYALFTFFFIKLNVLGIFFFLFFYFPIMYFVTQAKMGVIAHDSFKKGIKTIHLTWQGVALFLGVLGVITLLNLIFSSASAQESILLFSVTYLLATPFLRHYFSKFQLKKVKVRRHG